MKRQQPLRKFLLTWGLAISKATLLAARFSHEEIQAAIACGWLLPRHSGMSFELDVSRIEAGFAETYELSMWLNQQAKAWDSLYFWGVPNDPVLDLFRSISMITLSIGAMVDIVEEVEHLEGVAKRMIERSS